jgi:exodeoxyribonuclease VII large subunit
LKPYFEEATGQAFVSGIKVLVQVTVSFHELYGYSLTVQDIDPTYTLGDMARRRKEILKQLEEEGVLTLNKELRMPRLPQRIAVVSSPTAAGYGDFCHQLQNNPGGFYFYTELFPALMQGDRVEESVLSALDKINSRSDSFDVVVIIRGGGATSDLSGFDTYLLAAACAQFPLPVITGIYLIQSRQNGFFNTITLHQCRKKFRIEVKTSRIILQLVAKVTVSGSGWGRNNRNTLRQTRHSQFFI